MKKNLAKISLFILIGIIIYSCNSIKRVPEKRHILTKNIITVNDKTTKNEKINSQIIQQPNTTLLGYRLRLELYNLSKPNADSSYNVWLHKRPNRYRNLSILLSEKQVERLGQSFIVSGYSNFLKTTGEPPIVIDEAKTKKTINKLKSYYSNIGFFDIKASYKIDTVNLKKALIHYKIITGNPYIIDTIKTNINTPILDSLYEKTKSESLIKKGQQYITSNFDEERNRITAYFRNRGAYYFQQNYVAFDVDTLETKHKANVNLIITDRTVRESDSTTKKPFKLYKISKVNIFTNNSSLDKSTNIADSISYNNFNLYSSDKLNYKPKAITDAIFITKGSTYSDVKKTLTYRYLSNLKVFNYPSIQYIEDLDDPEKSSLIANIILTPRKKYSFGAGLDLTHSNIQDFGISGTTSLSIRNIFQGAETLEISAKGNIGSSRDLANPNNVFFNISEYGLDAKLNFPKIFLPFSTKKIIPKTMIPSTVMSFGYAKQRNIGLDKESFTGIINYNWNPKRNVTTRLDLLNIQYVKNLNTSNYFYVYSSSFNQLNNLARIYNTNPSFVDENNNLIIDNGTTGFINDVLAGKTAILPGSTNYKSISSIEERRIRLSENNLIFASNFSYIKSTKKNFFDNDFFIFKAKIETSGNFLSLLSDLLRQPKNDNERYTIFNIEYSQYVKTDFDFIKHWDLGKKNIFAIRAFTGIAIPYGNASSIPFSRSYFAGGANDIRGWQPYSLGPGSSGGLNDFNEANLKITMSAEYRFRLFGNLHSALFIDSGNIWNVFDNIEEKKYTFNGFSSLKELAVASGIGFRYDLNFFVVRLDFGFKTHDPARPEYDRWFKGYNFSKLVLNIGINYPF